MSSEQKLAQWKFHRNEATRLMNEVVNEVMLAEVEQLEEKANQPCDDKNCRNCKYLYQRSKLVNRANGTIYELKETYKCRVSIWGGVYGIICIHHACVKRGINYFGKAFDVYDRIRQHLSAIGRTNPANTRSVDRHFWTHTDNPDPLHYFRFVYFQEETDDSKRLELETQLMNEFRTRGAFGFNISQSVPAEDQFVVSPETARTTTSTSRSNALRQDQRKTVERERSSDISLGLLVALAIHNQQDPNRDNPKRGAGEVDAADIDLFIGQTFNCNYKYETLFYKMKLAIGVKSGGGGFREPHDTWFDGQLRSRKGNPPETYVYFLSARGIEEFNEWKDLPTHNNELKEIIKPNPIFGEGDNYKVDEHYDALISGKLLQISPVVKKPRL